MYEMLDAHFLSVVIIVGSIMVTPINIMAVYVFSAESPKKGLRIGSVFLIWGSFMVWVCLSHIPAIFAYPAGIGDLLEGSFLNVELQGAEKTGFCSRTGA